MVDTIRTHINITENPSILTLHQDFVMELDPHHILAIMGVYGLKAADITKSYALNQNVLEHLSKDMQVNGLFLLENLSHALVIWPSEVNWLQFNQQVNLLLLAWLSDYKNGASLDAALPLVNCLELHSEDGTINPKFQFLMLHLLAKITNQLDQYKTNYIQNFDIETGLPNHHVMINYLDQHLHTGDASHNVGLILVNLHMNFDEAARLKAMASSLVITAMRRIQEHLNDDAILFRVTPSELGILISHMNFPAQLNLIASRLVHAFESALLMENITLILKPYFGCVSSFSSKSSALTFYEHGKLALHHAMSKNYQIEVYDQHITASFSNIYKLDEAIIEALQQNELEIYLQPIVTLPSEVCANAEILLRWDSEEWKLVSAVRLIETIYKKGFGKVFIRWLINTACQQIAELITTHERSISLTINLSMTDLLDVDLPELLAQSIALWEIPAENLIIEITESDIMIDEDKTAIVMNQIVLLGCKLALDDFGTGYSSMARLRNMPIDLVKIDQSFVRNIAHSPQDLEIVQSVIKLAHSLGKQIVAEGVEDKACLDILKELKCEKIQGYYYGKPMPASEFTQWLNTFSPPEPVFSE